MFILVEPPSGLGLEHLNECELLNALVGNI